MRREEGYSGNEECEGIVGKKDEPYRRGHTAQLTAPLFLKPVDLSVSDSQSGQEEV